MDIRQYLAMKVAHTLVFNVFGHVHQRWPGSRNSVNVGVDAWDFMPVTLAGIERRARELPVNLHWADVERRVKLG